MDSGRFESNPRPFPLHRAINSIMGPVGLASDEKKLQLRIDLDKKIDELAHPDMPEGLWVVGDEIRLRQVLTNLASNAVKFTPDGGGEVALTTKLLEYHTPPPPPPKGPVVRPATSSHDRASKSSQEKVEGSLHPHEHGMQLAVRSESSHVSHTREAQVPIIRFRLEVSDSGPGSKTITLGTKLLY